MLLQPLLLVNYCLLFRALLRSPEIQKDAKQYEQVVQKVIAYMTLGVDVSPLFSEMIMVSTEIANLGNNRGWEYVII